MIVKDLITELLNYDMGRQVELIIDGERIDIEDVGSLMSVGIVTINADLRYMTIEQEDDVKEWKEKAELYDELKSEEE